ncbi:hypothetical protein D3Y57_04625 (plasmid) [Sphingomonas paeninsulae]|uniref:Uncharacterized protein n=1 Tax=Sphingomonas paeninsulae TaxID=2319844 RepID=A0A494T7K6_SPHPE|nr:hypothetical protein D3Y57_04625 [Sphingomonas paeninsulae]
MSRKTIWSDILQMPLVNDPEKESSQRRSGIARHRTWADLHKTLHILINKWLAWLALLVAEIAMAENRHLSR